MSSKLDVRLESYDRAQKLKTVNLYLIKTLPPL